MLREAASRTSGSVAPDPKDRKPMPRPIAWICCAAFPLVSLAPASAQDAPANSPESLKALSASLRETMLRTLPTPLHEKVYNWGETEKTPSRIKWKGIKPKMVYTQKNDGTWKKLRIDAVDPAKNLSFAIKNIGSKGNDTTTFDVDVALLVSAHYHQMNWQQGSKLWDATADARVWVALRLQCEATARFEKTGSWIPDLVYRLRVVKADASYGNIEVTHLAGLGGDLAKGLGDTL